MSEINTNKTANTVSPLESEGLRGDGQAKWYVVHTYSGHEQKVKVNMEKKVENSGMQDYVLDIVVPMEKKVVMKDGKPVLDKNGELKTTNHKIFPGYVMIKMIVTNESWYLVRNTEGVTGFVGHGSEPIPLTAEEVNRMGIDNIFVDLDIAAGDIVRVNNGFCEGLTGEVLSVNKEKQMITVKLSMLGRDTSVDLKFSQVSIIEERRI